MCGFAGYIGTDNTADHHKSTALAQAMADCIAHRGPDGDGVWVDVGAGIALAHRRLSILDLSPAGHQPMVSFSGRWVISYNGEIYNHLTLRAELESSALAPEWRGHSDTETLLACVEAWGVQKTLQRSVGMFAMALWDRHSHELWLARDRLGEKPLYYGWQENTFLFGSELKALRAHPEFNAMVDRGALALLLRHNYIPEPHSIYNGIRKLPPGCWLKLSGGQRDPQPVAYWSLAETAECRAKNPFTGTEAEALDTLYSLLSTAVREQMLSDVPLGALLSGGIDSTLITALMQANSARPVRTFTIGFAEKAYDEAVHARAVAAHLGTEHTEMHLSPQDALELIPRLPQMYDEPFADSSQLPTHLVMQLARRHVTVVLSGDAGDELFGGYKRHYLWPAIWRRISWVPSPARRALGMAMTALPAATLNRLLAKPAHFLNIALPGDKTHKLGMRMRDLSSLEDVYVSLVTEWSNASEIVVDASIPPNLLEQRQAWPRLADPVARIMALDTLTYLPGDILTKVDRAAMAVSLETRAPFLDRDVVEFSWRLPMAMKLRDGQGKWILRQLLDRHVPRALTERPKQGFSIPLDQWLRGPLRDWAESLLAEDRLRLQGYFDPTPIRKAWTRHVRGEASFGYRLWSVLMFQAWLEQQ